MRAGGRPSSTRSFGSGPALDEAWIMRFMFALPVQVVAQLLGIPEERFDDTMGWLGDYGAAAAAAGTGIPAPTPELVAAGIVARRRCSISSVRSRTMMSDAARCSTR